MSSPTPTSSWNLEELKYHIKAWSITTLLILFKSAQKTFLLIMSLLMDLTLFSFHKATQTKILIL